MLERMTLVGNPFSKSLSDRLSCESSELWSPDSFCFSLFADMARELFLSKRDFRVAKCISKLSVLQTKNASRSALMQAIGRRVSLVSKRPPSSASVALSSH